MHEKPYFQTMEKSTLPEKEERSTAATAISDFIHRLVNLEEGTDEKGTIEGIRRDVEFKGVNVWILVASIFIASIGLNTNSAAVIIGAMLISPLMGPIIGTGLAVGIMDFAFLKKSLKNFGITVGISIVTSTLYFALSPLSEAQSELLARTTPTIYDVAIALFGGLAGIIAGSRREKTNVVPGVAIATALMPPLCTAGYGIATGNLGFFLGALYLFFINSVFICFATVIMVRYLKFERVGFVNQRTEKRAKASIYLFLIITITPSIFIAYNVVQESLFRNKALKFVADYLEFPNRQVIKTELNYGADSSFIELSLLGKPLSSDEIAGLNRKLIERGMLSTRLIIHQAGAFSSDMASEVKSGIIEDLYKRNAQSLQDKEARIQALEQELLRYRLGNADYTQIAKEISVQYPKIDRIGFSRLAETKVSQMQTDTIPTILVRWKEKPSKAREQQLGEWLKLRLQLDTLQVVNY